jgi:hypothetical protein
MSGVRGPPFHGLSFLVRAVRASEICQMKFLDMGKKDVARPKNCWTSWMFCGVSCSLEFVDSRENTSLGQVESKVGNFFAAKFTFYQVDIDPVLDEMIEQGIQLLEVL